MLFAVSPRGASPAGQAEHKLPHINGLGEMRVHPGGETPLLVAVHGVGGHGKDGDAPAAGQAALTDAPRGVIAATHVSTPNRASMLRITY